MSGIEARVHALQAHETVEQQRCCREQRQRQGELGDHEGSAHYVRAPGAAHGAFAAERAVAPARAGAMQNPLRTDDDPGDHGQANGEENRPQVHVGFAEARDLWTDHAHHPHADDA